MPPGWFDEDAGLYRALVPALLMLGDPLADDPWGVGPLSPADIHTALRSHTLTRRHRCSGEGAPCRDGEIARIAHLVRHGWPPAHRDPHPVTVDVGVGDYTPAWPFLDGNHRLAAAAVRGDTHLVVSVCGDLDRAEDLLSGVSAYT